MKIILRLRILSYAVLYLLFLPFLGYSFNEENPGKTKKNKVSNDSPKDDLKPLPKLVLKSVNPIFFRAPFIDDDKPKENRPVKWIESANMVDCIRYELFADKKNVKIGEEVVVTVRLAFADGLPFAWRDEDCERLSIMVVFPKSFQQTGGSYFNFMPIRFDENNKIFEITIKGIFTKPDINGEFLLLKGPPISNSGTIFIKKKELYIAANGEEIKKGLSKTDGTNPNTSITNSTSIKDNTSQYSVTDECPTPTASGSTVCVGGTINLSASGGTTYSWVGPDSFTSSEANVDITNATELKAGVYTVTVSSGTCTATATVNVSINANPNITINSSNTCVGGSFNLSSSGGSVYGWTGPQSFSSSAQNPTINNATSAMAGVYTVTVSNANNCSATATTNVSIYALPTASITVTNTTVCQGGIIEMSGSGGATYSWVGPNSFSSSDEEVSINNASTLMEGVYTITVGSSNGCTATTTASINVTVITPPVIEASLVEICLTESPTLVTLTATGCSGGTILWNTTETGSTIQVSPLITGTYSARCQLSGCTSFPSNEINITVNNRPPAPTISTNKTVLVNNETATLTATGCSGTINWSNGMSGTSIGVTTNSILAITATCTLNGCVSNNSNSVTLTPCNLTKPTIALTYPTSYTSCSGNVSITPQGCTNYYEWEIMDSNHEKLYDWRTSSSFLNFQDNNLTQDSYYKVRCSSESGRGAGCKGEWSDEIFIPGPGTEIKVPMLTVDKPILFRAKYTKIYRGEVEVCESEPIVITASGCTGTYQWRWNNTTTNGVNSMTLTPSATSSFGALLQVLCVVNGCPSDAANLWIIASPKPSPPVLTTTNNNICAGQSITINATNVNNIQWKYSPSATYSNPYRVVYYPSQSTAYYAFNRVNAGCRSDTSNIIVANLITSIASTQSIIASATSICEGSNVTLTSSTCDGTVNWSWTNSAGSSGTVNSLGDLVVSGLTSTTTYKSKCTNACGTSANWSPTVTITVLPKPNITNVSANLNVCLGSDINLTALGGTTYSWSGPDSFSSTLQNPIINSATSAMAGVYTVTVANANNCTATATTNISINTQPTASITLTNAAVCQGGTIEMSGSGGTSYSWSGPNSFTSTASDISIPNASALKAGVYTLTASNSNGCTATATASVSVTIITPPVIEASTVEICLTESPTLVTLTATGCSGGTVLWTTTETGTSIQISPLLTGTYSATCKIGDCESLPSNVVNITVSNRPPAPTISADKTILTDNEIATLTATGCSGTINWSNGMSGSSIGVTTNSVLSITATCALDECVSDNSNTITLTLCNPPTIEGIVENINVCIGGTINLMASGGNTYSWAGPNAYTSSTQNPTISNATSLMEGIYTVTITNANNCTATATSNVIVNSLPTANITVTNSTVCQGGTIELTATGGGTYLWSGPNSFSGTTSSVSINSVTTAMAGTYTVTVTNTGGCSATATTSISVTNALTVTATGSTVCANATATVSATGGTTYAWVGPNGFSATGQTVNINNAGLAAAGVYTVTISNINNCTATATANVIINSVAPTQTIVASKTTICPKSNESITLTSGVCTGTINWQWTSTAGTGTVVGNPITISNLTSDVTYQAKCTNNCGISTDWSEPLIITIASLPVINTISSNTPIITEGAAINFTLTATDAQSYSWVGPHSFTSTLQNPTITETTEENTGIYTVTITNATGCTATATTYVEVSKDCKCTTCGTDGEGLSTVNPVNDPDFVLPSDLQSRNLIVENTYLDAVDLTKIVQNIAYMDGLGRDSQNIKRGVGGQGEDIISVTEYDNFGRENKKYLPFPKAGTNGYFVDGATSGIASYYQTLKADNHVYAETEFEESALQRVKKQGNVGETWQLDATTPHVLSFDYRANTTADAVMSLNYDFTTKNLKIVAASYAAGELMVTLTTNENGQASREFKNREGQIICKDEAINDATNTTRSYYVYDDLGLLRFVITPKAETELRNRAVNSLINLNPNGGDFFLKNLIYYYDYDARGLLIESAVPGMLAVKEMFYNKRDQLVLTRGPMIYANDNMIYNKYDDLNRLVSSGIYTGNESVATMRSSAESSIIWPTANLTEYLKNYYDNLSNSNYPNDEQIAFSTDGYNTSYSSNLQGKLVGTKTKIFSFAGQILTSTSNAVRRIELLTTNYYDNEGRLIQNASKNHKDGIDYTHKKFDFIGREIASKTTTEFKHWIHSSSSTAQTKIIETKSTYDTGGRIKSICQKNDSDAWEPVQRNTYNGIGELTSKLQGCSVQKVDYAYNIRGWLTDINDLSNFSSQVTSSNPDLFAMHLDYNGSGQYLGNITGQQWRTLKKQNATPNAQEAYSYTYDNLNRLLTGIYTGTRGGLSTEVYGTTPYDKIGAIQKLKRTRITDVTAVVDDLTYTYHAGSVTLQKITDAGDKNSFFKEPDNDDSDYTYNFNGSLTVDKNKYFEYSNGSGGIEYNALNLLSRIGSNTSNPNAEENTVVRNYYSGRGEKIRTEIASNAPGDIILKSTDYISGLVWINNSTVESTPAILDFIPTAEGRAILTSNIYGDTTPPEGLSAYKYEYHLKDHLGNLRAAYRCGDPKRDEEETILTESEAGLEPVALVQEIHYDPWGVTFGTAAEKQNPITLSHRWQYNAKEKVSDAGLNWLDYGARFYDPIIGRWHVADPLAQKSSRWTPYSYAYNNPIRFIDIDRNEVKDSYKMIKNVGVFIDKKTNIRFDKLALANGK